MLALSWTENALNDMVEIFEYISENNHRAAFKVKDKIEDTVKRLSAMPHGRGGRIDGTYEKVVSGLPYIIAYSIDNHDQKRLIVLRVIHTARDWREQSWPKK